MLLAFSSIKDLTFSRKQLYLTATVIVANGIMIAVPLFEARSAVYGFFIAILLILSSLSKDSYSIRLLYLLIIVSFVVAIIRASDFISLSIRHEANTSQLESMRGSRRVELMPFCANGRSDYILCHDISSDPSYFDNQSLSSFYNIDNVVIRKSHNSTLRSEEVFDQLKDLQRVPNDYILIHSGRNHQIYINQKNESADLIIESVGSNQDFYVVRGLSKSILGFSFLSLLPNSIAIYFADYLEDSTIKNQPSLSSKGKFYNYNYINNITTYSTLLIAPYSIDDHAISGEIIKCNLPTN